ncbi:MAG TPA: DUF1615 domain-containing protein [Vicinamibacterales bacterium]|nr:DUF1615 domain-containing protein [Vicinamibacterales bacterium]
MTLAMRSGFWSFALAAMALAACVSPPPRPPPVDPDAVRAEIVRLMPADVKTAQGWAIDIFAAFEALNIPPTSEHICGVLAVTEQESNFQVDPLVPGLLAIARREIEARAASHHIPKFMVDAALEIRSANGSSFRERLEHARTEKDLSELFEDFIGSVPLGGRMFGDWNPVRTGGPMQVSIEFAEKQAKEKHYPYPVEGNIRSEVFTRRGGLFFGIAHLLAYAAPYDDMVYRFADYNAGQYASRNAAFQNAVNIVSKKRLALDGDLLIEGADTPSNTELAIRTIGELGLTDAQIRTALEQGDESKFDRTPLYSRVLALADEAPPGRPVPRAIVPRIRLVGPKITRNLTTEWFAGRVDDRYRRCLAKAQ